MEDRGGGPRRKYVLAGVVAAVAAVLVFATIQLWPTRRPEDLPVSAQPDAPTSAGTHELKRTAESFRQIAKKLGPAVVNIKSTRCRPRTARAQRPGRGRRFAPPEEDEGDEGLGADPFQEFFERFGRPYGYPQETPQTSLGSGFIIDKQGIVVTNNHVIEDATEILVTLSSEKADFKAKLIGKDAKTDLAVLKIETKEEFPFADWADSDTVEVGDWAIAIGSPFALGQSVTVGIVSAKQRSAYGLTGSEWGGDLIQTDAAINPGNSGGPLCDLAGKVMGVNTAIYTRSGGYMGIGFAIPSNMARDVVDKLIKDGKIVRGWLGVYIQPLDPELAQEMGVSSGVGVHEVIQGGPADSAGLKAGDIILEVEGKAINEVSALQRIVSAYKPGNSVKLKVVSYADKRTRNVSVRVGVVPESDTPVSTAEGTTGEPDRLGVVVSGVQGGVVVEQVEPGSVADQVIGLETGDVIVRINRKNVDSLGTYRKLINGSKKIFLEVRRKGRMLFYQFTMPEQE